MIIMVVVDLVKVPSGWGNQLIHNSIENVLTIAIQSSPLSERMTHCRVDKLTVIDLETGEITQTADKALFSFWWTGTEQELIDAIILAIAIEYDKYNDNNDMNNSIQVVENKVSIEIVGDEQNARDYIAEYGAEWGEVSS